MTDTNRTFLIINKINLYQLRKQETKDDILAYIFGEFVHFTILNSRSLVQNL